MAQIIARSKMSKKARRELDKARRNTWGTLSPVTRRVESKKVYSRKKIRWEKDESFLTESFIYRLFAPITINLDKEVGQPVRLPFHLVPKLQ